jgi:hypothetical protein
MAVLSRILLATAGLAGCYSPQLRDCVVACASASDCAGDQVCGSDRLCVDPESAPRCDEAAEVDAGPPIDARPDAPPDANPNAVTLRVEIGGEGTVNIQGVGSCDDSAPMRTCTFEVIRSQPLLLDAIPDAGEMFDKWDSLACGGQDASCNLTPTLPVTAVKAKFRH